MERLEELTAKLNNNHRNVKISTITGASMGTVGGVLAAAGLVMAPITFGASLAVSAVGAGISGAGGLVMSGSKEVELLLEKIGLKDVQQAIEKDFKTCKQLQKQIDSLEDFIYELAASLRLHHDNAISLTELEGSSLDFLSAQISLKGNGTLNEDKVDFGVRFFRVVSSAATISASTVATMGRSVAIAGTRAAHIAGSAIGAALLPLDIALLVNTSLELHRGSTSTAVEEIRRILSEMKCPAEKEIEGLMERFIVEKFNDAYSKMKCDA